MKKELMKNLCRLFCMVGLILAHFNLSAQIEKTKTIDESFAVQKGALVYISHKKGALHIKKSTTNKVEARLYVSVTGNREGDAEKMLNAITLEQNEQSRSLVEISTSTNTAKWNKINGNSTIELRNGTRLKGIDEVEIDMEVAVPEGVNLKLENRYNNISIEEIKADVEIKNYNGNVETLNIDGDLKLNLKYGNATIGNVKDAELELYESIVAMGKCDDLKLDSKYSKHTFSTVGRAEIDSYEGNFEFGNVQKKLEVNDKYSVWTVGFAKTAKIKAYDAEWTLGAVNDLILRSKESEYDIGSAEEIDCEKLYQDEINVGTLGTLKCTNSKYFDAEVGLLQKGFYLSQDYNGDVEINKVATTFEGIEFVGKNSDLEIPLEDMKYQLDVDVKNGDISLEEDNLEAGFISEMNNKLQIKGKMNNASDKSPKVVIKGYNVDVDLD